MARRRRPVLLSAEDGIADTIRPRLEAAGADLSRIVVFDDVDAGPEKGWRPPIIPDDLGTLADIVRSEQAGLVIIDPLFAFLSSANDSYRDQDIRRALHLVKLLAESTGAAVGVVRHPTKGSAGASSIYAGGGSIGVVGAARVGLFMGRDPEDQPSAILAVAEATSDDPAESRTATRGAPETRRGSGRVGGRIRTQRGPDQRRRKADARDEIASEIVRLLSGGPRLKQAEIIRALDGRRRIARPVELSKGCLSRAILTTNRRVAPIRVPRATPRRTGGYVSYDTTTRQAKVAPATPRVPPPLRATTDTSVVDEVVPPSMYGPGAPS